MNTRIRILLGIGLLIVTIIIGYFIFVIFFAPKSPTDQIPRRDNQTNTNGQFPTTGNAGDRTGTDTPQTPTLPTTPSGTPDDPIDSTGTDTTRVEARYFGDATSLNVVGSNLAFYNTTDGKFYSLRPGRDPVALSDTQFFNVASVTWADGKNTAVLEYPDGSNIVYDFDAETQVTLPKHWEDFSFDESGSQITAKSITISPENNWIVTTDTNGQNIRLIEPMGANADKVILDWSPTGQVLGFSRTGEPLGSDRQQILLIGQQGENFKSLVVEGRDFRPTWSPSGKKLVYSVYSARNDFKPELWVTNASGDAIGTGRKYLNIQTWADKCAFGTNDNYIYCGIPTILERGAGFVPDSANNTEDTLYKINIETGAREVLDLGRGVYTIDSISIDEVNNTLYFTDKNKTGVFEVSL